MILPEMQKMRDVVVIARNSQNSRLVTIVPLSASQPEKVAAYHYQLPYDPRPDGDSMHPIWAKCDMIYTVSLDRLDRHYRRSRRGARELVNVQLSEADLTAILKCVAIALNISDNQIVPVRGCESDSALALNQPDQR
jgi:uncharacterized protein YifN (PemK superfamily)